MSTKSLSVHHRDDSSLSVIDPHNRSGKIQIPLSFIFETKGKAEALRSRNQKDLSLCLLFQNGKCNVGGKCHQIHADCEFVKKLRVEASVGSTCCAAHGDAHSKDILQYADRTALVTPQHGGPHIPMAMSSFAFTQGLSLISGSRTNVVVSLNRICRLHQQNRCKYGRDCRHVHMCREAHAALLRGDAPTRVEVAGPASRASPAPLLPELIEYSRQAPSDDTASARSESSADTGNDSLSLTNKTADSSEPEATSVLDSYLKGWTPSTSTFQANVWSIDSPLYRSPVDLRMLCTELLGSS